GQLAEVVDLHDVGDLAVLAAPGAGDRPRLLAEHAGAPRAGVDPGAQHLERHATLDVHVLALVDHAHAALAEPADDAIARAHHQLARLEPHLLEHLQAGALGLDGGLDG